MAARRPSSVAGNSSAGASLEYSSQIPYDSGPKPRTYRLPVWMLPSRVSGAIRALVSVSTEEPSFGALTFIRHLPRPSPDGAIGVDSSTKRPSVGRALWGLRDDRSAAAATSGRPPPAPVLPLLYRPGGLGGVREPLPALLDRGHHLPGHHVLPGPRTEHQLEQHPLLELLDGLDHGPALVPLDRPGSEDAPGRQHV